MIITKDNFGEPRDSVKEIVEYAYNNNPDNLERLLKSLKFHDTNPIISMIALKWKFNISDEEAWKIIKNSETWKGYKFF